MCETHLTYCYDAIPEELFQNVLTILEIGCNEQKLLRSKIGKYITKKNYSCLDVQSFNSGSLPFIQADIVNYEIQKKYGMIIISEVLEHIHFRDWNSVITKLKNALTLGGVLVVTIPCQEKMSKYIQHFGHQSNYYQFHTIFGIDRQVINHFFPDAKVKKLRYYAFRGDNASLLWAIGRFLKRIIIGSHLFRKTWLVIWKNGKSSNED